MTTIQQLAKERILVLDGAMGSMIQEYQLEEKDYRGDRFKNHSIDLKGNHIGDVGGAELLTAVGFLPMSSSPPPSVMERGNEAKQRGGEEPSPSDAVAFSITALNLACNNITDSESKLSRL